MDQERMTLKEAAAYSGLSASTLRVQINRERLKAERVRERGGYVWYVTRGDLDDYIEQRSRQAMEQNR